MAKFHVGQKAKVVYVYSFDIVRGIKVGDIVTVDEADSCAPYVICANGKRVVLCEEQMEPITAPPETLTINGVEYIRKPEPAHEWKFGDWARHPEYGVVFVGNVNSPDEIWCVIEYFGRRGGRPINPKELTYISSATIPV